MLDVDEVVTSASVNHDDLKFNVVTHVVKASGHTTYRVHVDTSDRTHRLELIAAVDAVGCRWEWSSESIVAITAATLHQLEAALSERTAAAVIEWEFG